MIDLEGITYAKTSEKKRNQYHMISLMCGI